MPAQPIPERLAGASVESAGAYSARVPLPRAAAAQAGASLAVLALAALVPAQAVAGSDVMFWALLQGIVAVGLSRGLRMEPWWIPIHLLFVPGLVWTRGFDLSPAFALSAFGLLASVYWGVSLTRVPLYLSNPATVQAVANLLPQGRSFSFLDLGCGLGGVLARLERARPVGRYYGIESAPLPFLLSWLRAATGARSCRIRWGDFRDLDLGRYDVVYAYLSPAAMGEMWQQARREMRSGSLLISNSFVVPGVPPSFSIATGAGEDAKLMLWRM